MAEVSCLLFAPPRPPVTLRPGEEVVLGRSADCQLPVSGSQASRRHAAVCWKGAVVLVTDLESTNGTRVNGEPVTEPRVLTPGDRIEIGESVVTFCRVESATATPPGDLAQTLVVDRSAEASGPPEVLRGDLREIPVFAVLQMLEMGAKTGALHVDGEASACRLWMQDGRIVHAETEKSEGMEAALAVAQVRAGRFDFTPGVAPASPSMSAGVVEVILEASRLLDEASEGE